MEKENDLVRDMEEEYESHIEALENGESFVPKLTAKSASTGQKRKRGRGDNGSSSKRRKGSHTDDDDDFEDNDDEVTDGNGSEGNNSDMDEDEEDEDEDEQMDEPITVDSLKAKIDECKSKSKEIRAQLNPAKQARKAVNDRLSGFQKELAKAQREKNAFCSLKRSEVSTFIVHVTASLTLLYSSPRTYFEKTSVLVSKIWTVRDRGLPLICSAADKVSQMLLPKSVIPRTSTRRLISGVSRQM